MKERTVIINAMSTVITYRAFANGEVTSLDYYTDKVFKDKEQALASVRKAVETSQLRILEVTHIGRIKTKYELPFDKVVEFGKAVSTEDINE